jgi:plasmid stabilization system protein ParE
MAVYSLSSKAAADLDQIHEYTILNFGLKQARAYLSGLHGAGRGVGGGHDHESRPQAAVANAHRGGAAAH